MVFDFPICFENDVTNNTPPLTEGSPPSDRRFAFIKGLKQSLSMDHKNFVVIMAGGRGERFWPQSRLQRPKHLLPIVGDDPMLTQTINRLGDLLPKENIFIITNAEQADAVREICPQIPGKRVIAEPVGRDTAPAVALATALVEAECPDGALAILPADHVIHDDANLQRLLAAAFAAARETGGLFTIGIQPEYPATGYGYIQRGERVTQSEGQPVFKVRQFVEKPSLEVAESYLESGDYFWNAGMFVWTVEAIKKAYQAYAPELADKVISLATSLRAGTPVEELLAEVYPPLKKISVDYAILEKAGKDGKVYTMPSIFDWDDVGEWPAVARHYTPDADGNVSRGLTAILDGKNNIILNYGGPLAAVLGVENMIVVQTPDATLVCPKDKAQEIKKLVAALRKDDTQHLL
jgi:mannose-1-phosphate guanylyltransferase